MNCLAETTAKAEMTVPATRAMRNIARLPIAKNTKIPPCGARRVTPNAMHSAPVMAPPNIIDGMTRSGSAAANGMAPSEMNEAPRSQAARPFSFSGSLNRPGRIVVASAMASGGTMPAATNGIM